MRTLVAVTVALLTSGCDNSQIQNCEQELTEGLKSPASYKRVSVEVHRIGTAINDPPYDSVTIKYDAANSFNALLRGEHTCFYRPGTTEKIENPFQKQVQEEVQRLEDAALNAATNAVEVAGNAVEQDASVTELDSSTKPGEDEVTSPRIDERDACLENATNSEDFDACNHGLPVDE